MTKFYSLLFASLLILGYSCRTASKSYKKGDYTDAIERGVKKLQKDPYDYDTRDLVQKSYNYTVNEHEDQIRMLMSSNSETRYEKIYQEYAALQGLYQTVHAYPAVAQMIKVKDYTEFVNVYRDKAAETHLQRAGTWMSEGTKDAYREAYKEYNIAVSYRPDDFQLRRKRDSVYDMAITKVLIAPVQYYTSGYGSGSTIQNFQRDILRTLSQNMNNYFLKFYTEYEARSENVIPDQILELNLSRISMGQPIDDKSVREVSKEVVVKEIVYKEDSVVKQMGKVTAKITTTKRTLLSQGDLYITMRDTKGMVIWNDRFTGEHKWQTEFSTYTGDERALSDADKALVNQSTNYNPPSDDTIMNSLLQQIRSDLSSRLRSYYYRYQ